MFANWPVSNNRIEKFIDSFSKIFLQYLKNNLQNIQFNISLNNISETQKLINFHSIFIHLMTAYAHMVFIDNFELLNQFWNNIIYRQILSTNDQQFITLMNQLLPNLFNKIFIPANDETVINNELKTYQIPNTNLILQLCEIQFHIKFLDFIIGVVQNLICTINILK